MTKSAGGRRPRWWLTFLGVAQDVRNVLRNIKPLGMPLPVSIIQTLKIFSTLPFPVPNLRFGSKPKHLQLSNHFFLTYPFNISQVPPQNARKTYPRALRNAAYGRCSSTSSSSRNCPSYCRSSRKNSLFYFTLSQYLTLSGC